MHCFKLSFDNDTAFWLAGLVESWWWSQLVHSHGHTPSHKHTHTHAFWRGCLRETTAVMMLTPAFYLTAANHTHARLCAWACVCENAHVCENVHVCVFLDSLLFCLALSAGRHWSLCGETEHVGRVTTERWMAIWLDYTMTSSSFTRLPFILMELSLFNYLFISPSLVHLYGGLSPSP